MKFIKGKPAVTVLIGLLIILILLTPLIVERIVFGIGREMNRPLTTYFSPYHILIYFGAILSSSATIIAILISISHQVKVQRREKEQLEFTQREVFSSNLLYSALRDLDSSRLINRKEELDKLLPATETIYNMFDAAHRLINVHMNFSDSEKKIMADELDKIQQYAKEYSDILWSYYGCSLVFNFNSRRIDLNEQFIEKIRNDLRFNVMVGIETTINFDDVDDTFKAYKEAMEKEKEILADIQELYKEIDVLYNQYPDIIQAVKTAMGKLKDYHKNLLQGELS